jgi:hypothetical protein
MADNVTASAGTGDGAVFATDDAAGVHHPYVKIEFGADNTQTPVSTSNPLPVVQTGTHNIGTVTTVTTVSAVTAITNALPAGTNAIGKLAANSGVDIGDVDVTSQPARAATTDTITAKLATDAIQNGTTALTPKFAVIDNATSGDNTIVSAVVGKKVRVLSLFVVAAAAVTVRFESGAGGTALTGQMNLAANGGFVLPFNPVGWFETASNTLLNMELGGAVSVDGSLCYVEV